MSNLHKILSIILIVYCKIPLAMALYCYKDYLRNKTDSTNLRIKVDRYEFCFFIAGDKWLCKVERTSLINTSCPFIVCLFLESKRMKVENDIKHITDLKVQGTLEKTNFPSSYKTAFMSFITKVTQKFASCNHTTSIGVDLITRRAFFISGNF